MQLLIERETTLFHVMILTGMVAPELIPNLDQSLLDLGLDLELDSGLTITSNAVECDYFIGIALNRIKSPKI